MIYHITLKLPLGKYFLHTSDIELKQYTHRAATQSTIKGRSSPLRPSTQVFRPIKIGLEIMIAEILLLSSLSDNNVDNSP
jgi:hypothetical protein